MGQHSGNAFLLHALRRVQAVGYWARRLSRGVGRDDTVQISARQTMSIKARFSRQQSRQTTTASGTTVLHLVRIALTLLKWPRQSRYLHPSRTVEYCSPIRHWCLSRKHRERRLSCFQEIKSLGKSSTSSAARRRLHQLRLRLRSISGDDSLGSLFAITLGCLVFKDD